MMVSKSTLLKELQAMWQSFPYRRSGGSPYDDTVTAEGYSTAISVRAGTGDDTITGGIIMILLMVMMATIY